MSFYPGCLCEWEMVGPELLTASSLGIFKTGINIITSTIPKQAGGWYRLWKRQMLPFLTKTRWNQQSIDDNTIFLKLTIRLVNVSWNSQLFVWLRLFHTCIGHALCHVRHEIFYQILLENEEINEIIQVTLKLHLSALLSTQPLMIFSWKFREISSNKTLKGVCGCTMSRTSCDVKPSARSRFYWCRVVSKY